MDTISRKPRRKVMRVEETTIPNSCPERPPIPAWKVLLECGHYVNLSRRKRYSPPKKGRVCNICKSQKGKS